MKRKNMVSTLCVLLALLVCGSSNVYAEKPSGKGGKQPPPALVSAITMKKERIMVTEELPGRTAAHRLAEIRPQVTGIITKRFFIEGSQVREGQQLYQIDPAPYKAAYAARKAALQKARANLRSIESRENRYAELVKIDAVSKQKYEDTQASLIQAEADIAVAKADLDAARINLDYTRVYAPISGQISESNVTEGALVTANQQDNLAIITQLDPIYVDMQATVRQLARMKQLTGRDNKIKVTLQGDIFGAYPHEGELQFSDVTVNPTTSSVKLRALLPNPDHHLLPGLFVKGMLNLAEKEVLLVPHQAAIRDAHGKLRVWVIDEDSTVKPRPITAAGNYRNNWVVANGLSEGEKIVTAGFQKIKPGAKVQVTPPDRAQAAQ